MNSDLNRLLERHQKFLQARAIADDVAVERGYISVLRKSELERLGFGRSQQLVPTLVIPVCSVRAEVESYQLRPDAPRLNDRGKPRKYEMKAGSRMLLDAHPRLIRQRDSGKVSLIADPSVPLFITEGIPKADAAISIGLCCIALLGVYNFRGSNEAGGKTALADWEAIALNDRTVYVAFDSDVMEKREVRAALTRIKGLLESRKAIVKLIYLPAGPHGEKVGLDDWVAGRIAEGLDDEAVRARLMALVTDALREPESNGDDARDDRGHGPRESVATQLVNLCSDVGVALFHDDEDECFATIQVGNHQETHPLESTAFRRWLIRLFDTKFKSAPNAQAIIDARATLASRAQYDGECRDVAMRVGKSAESIFIDLGDPDWSIVEVRSNGFHLIPYAECPLRFRRSRGTKKLPVPVRGGSVALLRKFANVTDAEWALILAYLVQSFRGCGPYPVLMLRGEQGTGKTTLVRVIKEITDPSGVSIRSAPREIRDIVAATRNAHVLAFDNVSKIAGEISDAICCLSTGGGFGGRALYTDNDEAVFTAVRPVMLTSITEVISRPDLLDRAIVISPPPFNGSTISTDDEAACRQAEKKLFADFERARPLIFGAVLDALAHGLAHVADVRLARTPRMVDFAIWASACMPAFNIGQDEFLDAYRDNRAGANEAALEASLISTYIEQLAGGRGWSGTPADLLEKLTLLAGDQARTPGFPKSPRAVRAALDRIHSNLRTVGIIVTFKRVSKGVRTINLSTVPPPDEGGAKQPSPPSQSSQSAQNEGLLGDGPNQQRPYCHPTVTQPSPGKTHETQKEFSEGYGCDGPLPLSSCIGDDDRAVAADDEERF
jgi:hypothetical protein